MGRNGDRDIVYVERGGDPPPSVPLGALLAPAWRSSTRHPPGNRRAGSVQRRLRKLRAMAEEKLDELGETIGAGKRKVVDEFEDVALDAGDAVEEGLESARSAVERRLEAARARAGRRVSPRRNSTTRTRRRARAPDARGPRPRLARRAGRFLLRTLEARTRATSLPCERAQLRRAAPMCPSCCSCSWPDAPRARAGAARSTRGAVHRFLPQHDTTPASIRSSPSNGCWRPSCSIARASRWWPARPSSGSARGSSQACATR